MLPKSVLTIARTFRNSWVSKCSNTRKRGYESSARKDKEKRKNSRSVSKILNNHVVCFGKMSLTFKAISSVLGREAVKHLRIKRKTCNKLKEKGNQMRSGEFHWRLHKLKHYDNVEKISWNS